MNKEQKDVINRNFEYIVNNCRCDVLLPRLRGMVPISNDEYNELDAIDDRKSQCREVMSFLMHRGPNTYDAIVNALVETQQYSVLSRIKPDALNGINQASFHEPQIHHPTANHSIQRSNKVFQEPNYYDAVPNTVNVTAQDEPLNVIVKLASNFDYQERDYKMGIPFYNTTSKNRGLVKIINIYDVENKKSRKGSEVDVANLKVLFSQIGFTVDVNDTSSIRPTKMNILRMVDTFVNDERLRDADIAILFIMSHGGHHDGKDFIYCCEGEQLYIKNIETYFSNDKCKYMQDKPKLLFFQSCRGIAVDYGSVKQVEKQIETDSHVQQPAAEYMPTNSDLLIAYSTCAGTASHRDTHVGTWFIYLICDVFMNHAYEQDIETMLKIVYDKLKYERTPTGSMQTGEHCVRTFKKCYLNPGIFLDNGRMQFFSQVLDE